MKKLISAKQIVKHITKEELKDLFIKLVPNKEKFIAGVGKITESGSK